MKKILILIAIFLPMIAFAQNDTIPEAVLKSGEYQFIIDTNCDLSEVEDNLIVYFNKALMVGPDKVQVLQNSMILPMTLLIHEGPNIKEYLVGNMRLDFKESRIRFTLSEMTVFNKYIQYDSFSKKVPLSDYCFVNVEKQKNKERELENRIQSLNSLLETKLSKKEKKETQHQLEIANAELRSLKGSFEYDVKFGKPRNKKEVLHVLNKMCKELREVASTCDNW